MSIDREIRYKVKIDLIEKRIDELEEWLNIPIDDFILDEKTKLAVYKAFQEIVESSMDIIAMICKDMKILPQDDYTNIENLSGKLDINEDVLKQANGLRNRLIHRYNKTDDRIAFNSIKEILDDICCVEQLAENKSFSANNVAENVEETQRFNSIS